MKYKILNVAATTALATLLTVGAVFAATTISSDISTGALTTSGVTTLGSTLAVTGAATLSSTLGVTGTLTGTKISINNTTSTAGALKIHSHQMQATTDDSPNQYANEFKGEFLATSGTMDGIAAHYHMQGSGTGVMRSILGDAYLDTGTTLSGTSASGSWISGILGDVDVQGTVNGSAVTVTGVYGGLGSMTGGTLTAVSNMSAIWADSQATQVPLSGNTQLILATNSGSGTIGSGIRIANSSTGAITKDITLQNNETIDNATDGTIGFGAANLTTSGTIVSSNTGSIGWSVVSVSNQACNNTCTNACVFGQESTSKAILACTDATADVCVCAGAN